MSTIQGLLVNGRTVWTFRIVHYIVGSTVEGCPLSEVPLSFLISAWNYHLILCDSSGLKVTLNVSWIQVSDAHEETGTCEGPQLAETEDGLEGARRGGRRLVMITPL